ncbi:MAG: ThuA domain-containing protein [Candidatus Latescibacterota bacterium]
MGLSDKGTKQGSLKAGAAAVTAAPAAASETAAGVKPKAPGEVKVVALFGTTERYNGISSEIQIRKIFESKKDWRFVFVRANKLFTPDLIKDADLLIVCRDGDADPIDLFTNGGGVSDSVVPGGTLWTDTNVTAIMENVQNRGMGLIAMQGTIQCKNQRFLSFLDVVGMEPHNFEPMWYTRMNKTHPVTQGVGKFSVMNDEQPLVLIKSSSTVTLFESTAVHEKRQGVSGWALEKGKGKIVGLLPGCTLYAYQAPEYQTIIWRAAHWAMNRSIPPYPKEENRYYL